MFHCFAHYAERLRTSWTKLTTMIVFGHNNFLVKKYTSVDLNLPPDESFQGVSFEVRQRYAHLFWIPFFPIRKLWAIKKPGDNNLYEMPVQFKQLILAQKKSDIKTPWYSWSLFFWLF